MLDFLSVCLCPPEVEVCGDEVSVLPAGVSGGGGEWESTVHESITGGEGLVVAMVRFLFI